MRISMILVSLSLAIFLLTACGGAGAPVEAPPVAVPTTVPTPTANLESVALVADPAPAAVDYCLECHIDKQQLIDTAKPEGDEIKDDQTAGLGGEMAPLEPWEKVLVDGENFTQTVHGRISCIACHSGAQSADKEVAHQGLIARPSADSQATCGACHPNIAAHEATNLHSNLQGYWTVLTARSSPSRYPQLEQVFTNTCSRCHTTCGDCHVSQPGSVGGGFISGHLFNATPSMNRNCAACHGSRVGNEYLGKHDGIEADVHFRQGEMSCVNCHSGAQMHGQPDDCQSCHPGPEKDQIAPSEHRYDGVQSPRCETCHISAGTGQDGVIMHQMHGADLSCQVCHSVAYTSCDGCHVAINVDTGDLHYSTDAEILTFLIGRNPIQSYQRPYRFVPVRHVPISRDSFQYYGEDLLPNFDKLETWKYTTPHNIQRNTPQNETCNACHGNAELFLTADKVAEDELIANLKVIIESIPPLIQSADQLR